MEADNGRLPKMVLEPRTESASGALGCGGYTRYCVRLYVFYDVAYQAAAIEARFARNV